MGVGSAGAGVEASGTTMDGLAEAAGPTLLAVGGAAGSLTARVAATAGAGLGREIHQAVIAIESTTRTTAPAPIRIAELELRAGRRWAAPPLAS